MTVVCRNCGKENPDDSAFCNACGRAVETPPPTLTPEGKACPHCGASNPVVVSFCQHCARAFPPPAPVPPRPPAERSGRTCWQCGAAIGLHDMSCPKCGCDFSGASLEISESVEHSQKPMFAAIMFAGAGVLDIVSALMLLTYDGYIPEYGVDVSGVLGLCGTLALIFGGCALLAAFMSYRRDRPALTLVAGTLGMLGVGPLYLGSVLSFIGIVIVALARDEFSE